jgi:hypothetical protein
MESDKKLIDTTRDTTMKKYSNSAIEAHHFLNENVLNENVLNENVLKDDLGKSDLNYNGGLIIGPSDFNFKNNCVLNGDKKPRFDPFLPFNASTIEPFDDL